MMMVMVMTIMNRPILFDVDNKNGDDEYPRDNNHNDEYSYYMIVTMIIMMVMMMMVMMMMMTVMMNITVSLLL